MSVKDLTCDNCGKPLKSARAPHTLDKVVTSDSGAFCCPDCLFGDDGSCACPEATNDDERR
jgi:hypothetical protein